MKELSHIRYRVDLTGKEFCVYAHKHENTIFYIGQGKPQDYKRLFPLRKFE